MTAPIELALSVSIIVNAVLIYLLVQAVKRWFNAKDTVTDLNEELADAAENLTELERERDVWRRDAVTSFANAAGWEGKCDEAHMMHKGAREEIGRLKEDHRDARYACEILGVRVDSAAELMFAVMRDEVNAQDECEKWLRDYAPQKLREAYPEMNLPETAAPVPAKDDLMGLYRGSATAPAPAGSDPVNHPKHYNSLGANAPAAGRSSAST